MCSPMPEGSRLSVAKRTRGFLVMVNVGKRFVGLMAPLQAPICRERLTDNLVHIVIFVSAKPPDERYVISRLPQCRVLFVKSLVLWAWNGIIWIPVATRVFIADARLRMHLARQMLIFGNARVRHILR